MPTRCARHGPQTVEQMLSLADRSVLGLPDKVGLWARSFLVYPDSPGNPQVACRATGCRKFTKTTGLGRQPPKGCHRIVVESREFSSAPARKFVDRWVLTLTVTLPENEPDRLDASPVRTSRRCSGCSFDHIAEIAATPFRTVPIAIVSFRAGTIRPG